MWTAINRSPSERYLWWLTGNLLVTACVACLAFELQQAGVAPAIFFPMLVGAAIAFGSLTVFRSTRVSNLRVAIASSALWGLLAVVGQDYIGHRQRLHAYAEEVGRQQTLAAVATAEMSDLRPDFAQHLSGVVRRQPWAWGLDVALTIAAATGLTTWRLRAGASQFVHS